MSQIDPIVQDIARRLANGGEITPEEQIALENAVGPNLNADQLGKIATGEVPGGLGGTLGTEGGAAMAADDPSAMTDRAQAGVNSTATARDVALAEMHARHGNNVAAENVAGGAAALDEATDRAAYAAQADMQTAMNALPGETPDQTRARLEEEAAKKGGQDTGLAAIGGMVAGFMSFKTAMAEKVSEMWSGLMEKMDASLNPETKTQVAGIGTMMERAGVQAGDREIRGDELGTFAAVQVGQQVQTGQGLNA